MLGLRCCVCESSTLSCTITCARASAWGDGRKSSAIKAPGPARIRASGAPTGSVGHQLPPARPFAPSDVGPTATAAHVSLAFLQVFRPRGAVLTVSVWVACSGPLPPAFLSDYITVVRRLNDFNLFLQQAANKSINYPDGPLGASAGLESGDVPRSHLEHLSRSVAALEGHRA